MYYFYIIFSNKIDRYYYGHSQNLTERLRKHNSNHKGWTGKTNDWKIVYSEPYDTKELAYERERQIKKWKNKNRIQELINKHSDGSVHPD